MIYEGHAVCKDCGQPFTWVQLGSGGLRQMCDACRRRKKRAEEAPRKARAKQRRKERDAAMPDRIRAIVEREREAEQ